MADMVIRIVFDILKMILKLWDGGAVDADRQPELQKKLEDEIREAGVAR
jgi:hypothetical protein